MNEKKEKKYTTLLIPVITTVSISNGIISGITSVITAYFFKPIWLKIMNWNKKQ